MIENEFDDLCRNFSIQPNTPTNLKPKSGSSTPLFSNDSPYGVLELCDNSKDTYLSLEVELAKLEIDHESASIKQIGNVWNKVADIAMKASPTSCKMRYTLTVN